MVSLFREGQRYQQYRPDYPASLFDWLARQCPAPLRALDLGCGSGQASRGLEPHFHQVLGADISPGQLRGAPASRSHYLACQAHQLPLPDHSLDLILVAQAFHWFDQPGFFREVRRTLKPGGVLALVSYGLCRVEGLTGLIADFHDRALAPWWPAERTQVVNGYPDVHLDWPALADPGEHMERHWRVDEMLGYLATWSALVKARAAGQNPLAEWAPTLERAWGKPSRKVTWPLRIKAWKKSEEW